MIKQRFKIQEIAKDFGDAPFGSNLKSKDYTESGIPVIQGGNIVDQKFEWNNKLYVSEQKFNSLKRSHCRAGDLVFPKIGNRTVSSCTIVPVVEGHKIFLLSTNMMKVSVKPEIANLQYVYYYFCQKHIRQYIVSIAGGGAQPIFNLTTLKNFEIELPHLPLQRKIAGVLSAYDDLIENNTRRIEILEEMARSIYREWFVKFRFPGHEQVQMVDSGLGLIPEGWEIVSFTDIADILSGGTPKTRIPEYWGGDIPFFTPKDASSSFYVTETDKSITELGLKKCNSKLYPQNTVFITARGTVGKAVLTAVDMAMNQSCFALKGREDINQYFIFLTVNAYAAHLKQTASGATFDAIIIDNFRRLMVVKPPLNLLGNFGTLIQPFFEKILNLLNKNANLRQTRDLLLPRLISGEIDVENLDINTGSIAA